MTTNKYFENASEAYFSEKQETQKTETSEMDAKELISTEDYEKTEVIEETLEYEVKD